MINERLAELRQQKGVSRRELSFALGLEQSTYGKYELGQRQPSLEILQKLADYFDVSTDYILGKSEDPTVELNIPSQLEGVHVAFNRGEFEDLTQEEVDRIAEFAQFVKSQRK